jgi:hypothetical protein
MAMTAWSAKVSSSLIWVSVNGRTFVRRMWMDCPQIRNVNRLPIDHSPACGRGAVEQSFHTESARDRNSAEM